MRRGVRLLRSDLIDEPYPILFAEAEASGKRKEYAIVLVKLIDLGLREPGRPTCRKEAPSICCGSVLNSERKRFSASQSGGFIYPERSWEITWQFLWWMSCWKR